MVESHSTIGLVIVSKLYSEGKIDDESREKLKDMIFSEDAILMSLFERYEDEEEMKEAVLKYHNGGALEVGRPDGIDAAKGDASELDMASSPTDSALDMKKRQRLNQLAAKEKEQQKTADAATVIGISDCDLGASPTMSKNTIIPKNQTYGKMSPLAVQARYFSLNNKPP